MAANTMVRVISTIFRLATWPAWRLRVTLTLQFRVKTKNLGPPLPAGSGGPGGLVGDARDGPGAGPT